MTDKAFSSNKILKRLETVYKKPLSSKIKKAYEFAYDAHINQFRVTLDDKKIPYIVHPIGVAINVIKYYNLIDLEASLDDLIILALLHDVLEDTNVTFKELNHLVDQKGLSRLSALTKPSAHKFKGSNKERNETFLKRIVESGPITIFIKICDSIHNLSKPEITPKKLFQKQIIKAQNDYLSMINKDPKFEKLKETYLDLIKVAKEKSKQEKGLKGSFDTLELAIKHCSNLIQGKTLELHDITEILKEITSANSVSIWNCLGKNSDIFDLFVQTEKKLIKQNKFVASSLILAPRQLEHSYYKKIKKVFNQNYDCKFVYSIPLQINTIEKFMIVIAFNKKHDWINVETLNLFLQILSHKLLITENDRRLNLATHANNLELDINIEKAMRINLTLTDLEILYNWRDLCQKAIVFISSLVNNFLIINMSKNIYAQLFKIDSRVKSANSIIDKIQKLNIGQKNNFKLIEDIAGVRIVCPTYFDLENVYSFLLEKIEKNKNINLHPLIKNNIRNYIDKPTINGYKAIHLILEIEIEDEDLNKVKVPCEVQLRTYFDDIWANLSHLTTYKNISNKKKTTPYLKELANNLKNCEKILFSLNNELNKNK